MSGEKPTITMCTSEIYDKPICTQSHEQHSSANSNSYVEEGMATHSSLADHSPQGLTE